jgi:hypothetical protein
MFKSILGPDALTPSECIRSLVPRMPGSPLTPPEASNKHPETFWESETTDLLDTMATPLFAVSEVRRLSHVAPCSEMWNSDSLLRLGGFLLVLGVKLYAWSRVFAASSRFA